MKNLSSHNVGGGGTLSFLNFETCKIKKICYNGDMKHHFFRAFTLAEVLITLGIIGVVAALTMPSLITNHQKKVFAVKAKKAYSTITQAIKLYEAKEESYGDVTGLFDTSKTSAEVAEAFSQYFSVVKTCFTESAGCNNYYQVKYTTPLYSADNKAQFFAIGAGNSNNRPYFILKDGTFVAVRQYDTCHRSEFGYSYDDAGEIKKDESGDPIIYEIRYSTCADITFDTNGDNGPNQAGMDVFELRVGEDGRFTNSWYATGWDNLQKIMQGDDFAVSKYNIGDEKK